MCYEEAGKGKRVALICSGDAGIYGMASLMYEMSEEYPSCELTVIPGITAASSGAAVLGAPLNHDFCVISLSDLLTPWEQIKARLQAAGLCGGRGFQYSALQSVEQEASRLSAARL